MVALKCLKDVVICTLLVLLGGDLSQTFRQLIHITISELLVAITSDKCVKQSWVQT